MKKLERAENKTGDAHRRYITLRIIWIHPIFVDTLHMYGYTTQIRAPFRLRMLKV